MSRKILLAVLFFALSLTLAGCLFGEPSIEKTAPTIKQTPTPAPTAAPQQANKSNSTNATATATALPSPSPSPQGEGEKPECTISVNPNDAQGPFKALAAVRFFNYPEPGKVTIKCSSADAGSEGERHGDFYYAKCDYPYAFEKKIMTASATADIVSCATTIVVEPNAQFAKMWTFSPGDDMFTVNKTQGAVVNKNYTIENSGTLPLEGITCAMDRTWATASCPGSLAAGQTDYMKMTFDTSSLTGLQSTILTVKEKDLQKSFTIDVTTVT